MRTQYIASYIIKPVTLASLMLTLFACGGQKTFNDYARAGDTVAVAGGWQQDFNVSDISIDIKQGPALISSIPQGDPAIRASVNLYPDPISGLIVSRETGIEMTPFANTYEGTISNAWTGTDKDWYQTTVFVDLPTTLAVGNYRVIVKNTLGASFSSDVSVIAGVGTPSTLSAVGADLSPAMIAGISRMPHYTVDFAGATIPHAIEVTLTHDPDSTAGGSGKAFAANPIGYKKNLSWNDDGTSMTVIMMPSTNTTPDNILDYKFYVTGGISNLVISSAEAYDINGNVVPGVTASTTFHN